MIVWKNDKGRKSKMLVSDENAKQRHSKFIFICLYTMIESETYIVERSKLVEFLDMGHASKENQSIACFQSMGCVPKQEWPDKVVVTVSILNGIPCIINLPQGPSLGIRLTSPSFFAVLWTVRHIGTGTSSR